MKLMILLLLMWTHIQENIGRYVAHGTSGLGNCYMQSSPEQQCLIVLRHKKNWNRDKKKAFCKEKFPKGQLRKKKGQTNYLAYAELNRGMCNE